MRIIVPETGDLGRVFLVLGAVRDKISPHASCGLSQRQASYALQTSQALGLLTRTGRKYSLTAEGTALLDAEPSSAEARRLLRAAIEGMDLVRDVVPNLLDAGLDEADLARVLEQHAATGLAQATAKKRATALITWRAQVEQKTDDPGDVKTALLVHLSDMHFVADGKNNSLLDRSDKMVRCLRGRFGIRKPDACVVLMTGDIAQSGRADEYKIAGQFVSALRSSIRKRLGLDAQFVMVPGNHDCDFDKDNAARRKLLEHITFDEVDQSMVDVGEAVQADYRAFAQQYEASSHTHFNGGATVICSLTVGDRVLRFDKYNSAWCSRRHEVQGSLLIPVPKLPQDVPYGDAVVALFHHPLGWIHANNARTLRDHIDTTADIVLTGHEHLGSRYRKTLETGERTEYMEGLVLQSRSDPDDSGFSALVLDFDVSKQQTMFFSWDPKQEFYVLTNHFPPRQFLRTKQKARSQFPIVDSFASYLRDPGDLHKHPKKRDLELNDIFVYPELSLTLASKPSGVTNHIIKNPLQHVLKERQVLIAAPELIGKTALAKRLFEDLHREGKVPVIVQGSEIRDPSSSSLEEVRNAAFKRAYGAERLERFLQLDDEERALIIDDAHESPLAPDELDRAVRAMVNVFEYAVVFVAEDYPMALLDACGAGGSSLLSFETCAIQPFGAAVRYRLIEKWCYLGHSASDDKQALSRWAQQLDELIGKAMGTMLPTFPSLILLCIQQIESARESEAANGSFGHLYDALLTRNLYGDGGFKIDVGTKRTFLTILAFELYASQKRVIHRVDWDKLYERYRDDYDVTYPHDLVLRELVDSGLICETDEGISFRYKYAFCFFVAAQLAQDGPEAVKQRALELCSEIHNDESANILLFLAHVDRTGVVYDALLQHSRSTIPGLVQSFDLHSRLLPLGDSAHISQLTLDADTPEERRVLEREQRDKVERSFPVNSDAESKGLPEELLAHIGALRTIHILGQVLKGSAGTMKAEQKAEVLQECYDLGYRTAAALVTELVNHHDELAADVARLLLQHRPELETDLAEVKSRVREFLIYLCENVVYGASLHVSHAVGAPALIRTYDRVLEQGTSTQLHDLFDLAVRLDHLDKFPEARLKAVEASVGNKPSPYNVLRRLIWRHLCLFPMGHKQQQSLCSRFDIKKKSLMLARRKAGADK